MLKTLQKHAPTISILLLIALLVALLFYPDSSRALSMGILTFSIGTAIVFIIHRNWQKHNPSTGSGQEHSEKTHSEFLRNTALDLIGLALTMGAAIWLGRLAGGYAGMAGGSRAGQHFDYAQYRLWGMLAGILAGMTAGFFAAWSVGRVWEMVRG